MTNSADPGKLALEVNWSGATLFAKAVYIRVQQDNGQFECLILNWSFKA